MITIETDGSRADIVAALLEAAPDAPVVHPGDPELGGADRRVRVSAEAGALPVPADTFQRFVVELVLLDGRAVLADVAELRYRPDGRLAARLSLDPADDVPGQLFDLAIRAARDLNDGAVTVRIVDDGDALRVDAVAPGLSLPLPTADASFVAWGLSAAHLLAESITRPEEFARRFAHPRRRRRSVATIWLVPRDGNVRAHGGLVDLRRLPSFHSICELAPLGSTVGEGSAATLSLVGDDPESVRQSMEVALEMEDAGRVFGPPLVTIALDPRGRDEK